MFTKWLKFSVICVVLAVLAGGLLFGSDLLSYVRSSAKSVQSVVKDSVPIEFELRRAEHLLGEIIPQMHANIRLIAQEEVEIAHLTDDIARSDTLLAEQAGRIRRLRDLLDLDKQVYVFDSRNYTRSQVAEELSRSFERFKDAELVLSSKRRLLSSRENSLKASMTMLDRTRSREHSLREKIASLESQYRLVKAAAVGSSVQIDSSKLAQTEKLLNQIKKRLDVAERVLSHESQFVEAIPIDVVSEEDLLVQVDEYFSSTESTDQAN